MLTYQAEKDAGIDSQMNKAGSSTAFVTAQVRVGDIKKYFDGMSVSDLVKATNTVQTVEELLGQKQPDLALVVAILVSTGWNLNDDIFTPAELWKARQTPLHKPMNDNHKAGSILGHIVQTRVIDKTGNQIDVEEGGVPPDEFDIEVAGVLYRAFPQLSDRIDEIITKAKTGEMFVSMEAWFPDFAYGFIDPSTGQTRLIDRTEETAFLTKHLRIYDGSGEYGGYKIGRVLKDIIFGAQGFVDVPANPESVIKVAANKIANQQVFVTAELGEFLEGGVEDVDEKQLKELQEKLEEALANLEIKEKEIVELRKTAEEFKARDYDGQIASLVGKVEELTTSATETSNKIESIEATKVDLQKQLDEVTKRADKGEAELEVIRKAEIARDRFEKLAEVKDIVNEDATLVELREMTDETFAIVLKYAGKAKSENVTGDELKDSGKDKTDEVERVDAVLDNVVETDDGPDLNASESAEQNEANQWMQTANALCGRTEEKD